MSFAESLRMQILAYNHQVWELKMSIYSHQMMTNNHVPGIWTHIGETLHIWRLRYQERQELARWTERDLHDVGLSWSDIANEVDKPFWRA
jgi:uncharacterized protein YjiS (DUF1127 family)